MVVTVDDPGVKNIDIVNAKSSESVVLDLLNDMGEVRIRILDCMGHPMKEKSEVLNRGLHKFDVPASGLLSIAQK
jgi:hypothetical protein